MTIIKITESIISEAVKRLNRVSGGESAISFHRDGMNRPYAHIRDWESGAVNAMSEWDEYDADLVADALGLEGEAFEWCDGGDYEFAIVQFDTYTDRDIWRNQI